MLASEAGRSDEGWWHCARTGKHEPLSSPRLLPPIGLVAVCRHCALVYHVGTNDRLTAKGELT